MPDAPVQLHRRLLVLAVVTAACLAYANALANGFAFDDVWIIPRNALVHDWRNLPEILLSPYFPDIDRAIAAYRPITVATYAVDWALGGGRAAWFHLVNILLHALASTLVLRLLLRLGAASAAAAAGAVIFAVHPVHTEAVANVVGRAELLTAVFVLAGCLAYLDPSRTVRSRAALVLASFALALGAKETGIVFPALLLLLAALRPGRQEPFRRTLRRDWRLLAGCLAVAAAYLGLRVAVLGTVGGVRPAAYLIGMSTADRLATAVRVWPEYLRLLLFPRDLVADYAPAVILPATWSEPMVWLALALGLATLGVAVAARHRYPLMTLAVGWFAIAIAPVSNLLFASGVLLAERTLYLPSVGVAFLVPAAAAWLANAPPVLGRAAAGVAAGLVLLGGARTWTRNPAWASTEAVYATLAREHPESYRAMWMHADEALRAGDVPRGLALYHRAFLLVPHDQQLGSRFAEVLLVAGYPRDAAAVMRLVFNPDNRDNYVLLAQSLLDLGDDREAVKIVRAGLERFAYSVQLLSQAAIAAERLGEVDAAARFRREALRWHRADSLVRARERGSS